MRAWQIAFIFLVGRFKHSINFSTSPKKQREIIFHVARIATILEDEFDSDSSRLTSENVRSVVFGTNEDPLLKQISKQVALSISRIKEIAVKDEFYEKFLEKLAATWETHKLRDHKESKSISEVDALQSCEDRGGFYFLALLFALQPTKNLTSQLENMVYLSGAWIQLVDDYADREKDLGHKNTLFTIPQTESAQKLLGTHKSSYKNRIQSLQDAPSLIVLLGIYSFVWPIITYL